MTVLATPRYWHAVGLRGVSCQQSAGAAINRCSPRLAVGGSCVELPREPLGVAGGADRAVEIEGFPERPVGRRRVADRGRQATTQLQDSRRQRATLDRRDQVLGAFESGLDLGTGADT